MTGLARVVRSAGVLFAVWGIAALVAWIGGVLPPVTFGASPGPSDSTPEPSPRTPDTDTTANRSVDGGSDPPVRPAPRENASTFVDAMRISICDGAGNSQPTLRAAHVVGDSRPELLVGCGPRYDLYGVVTTGDALTALRVASFSSPAAPSGRLTPGRPDVGDVNGDSLPDVVLPFLHLAEESTIVGGSLHLLSRNLSGAFDRSVNLASTITPTVVVAQLDGSPGFDVVALQRGDPLARRPSEAWVFAGGPSPRRIGVYPSGVGATSLALTDLDRDGERDIIVAAEENAHLDVFFGDGTGHYPRHSTIAAENVRELTSGDLDGDGGQDVIVAGDQLGWIRAGPAESLAVQRLDVAPELEEPLLYDIDGDGDRDIVGLLSGHARWFSQEEDLSFQEHSLVAAPGLAAVAYCVGDFDHDGSTDASVIQPQGSTYALVLAQSAIGQNVRLNDIEVSTDAPLSLRVQLE